MDVVPLSPVMGTKVAGVDVRRVEGDELAQILAVWDRSYLLVLPGQEMGDDDIRQFATHFGGIRVLRNRRRDGTAIPPVDRISNLDADGNPSKLTPETMANYYWHTDQSFTERP